MGFTGQEIANVLGARGIGGCPMCDENDWSASEGVIALPVSQDLSSMQDDEGPTIPAVAIACSNCGFLSLHAATVLGLTEEVSPPR